MAKSRSQILNEMRRAQRQAVSKINQEINRVNRQNKQAVDKHNREVDRVNRQNKQAVDKYNRDVRAHNARVKANQQRVRNEWAKLSRQSTSTSTQYTVYRTSVQDLHSRYVELDRDAEAETHNAAYDRIVDLSEREVANSLAVTNSLLNENNQEEIPDQLVDTTLTDELAQISPDLNSRWGGAKFALSSQNPEASRHFCTSAREIFIQILDIKAPDVEVLALFPNETIPDNDKVPTRKAKVRFCLHKKGIISDALEEFVDENVKNVLSLFRVFNDGTHGSSGKFSLVQLTQIRKRVEDGILYLAQIVN